MKVKVRLFALYRERAGRNQIEVTIPEGATVADLVAEVRRQLPQLAPPQVAIVAAVDTEYADPGMLVQPGADVCLIPPVSGG